MNDQASLLPGPRISRVTLARLHNLGNFEHMRYEVTVELPPGTSPASVLREVEDTLNALEPRQPVSDYQLHAAMKLVVQPVPTLQPATDDDPFDSPEQALRRALQAREDAAKQIARHEAWLASRSAALQRFDVLGGTSTFTDRKDRE
jgi:hypothetical protein